MTLKGRAIDLFLVPRGVTPGSVLTVGDTFSFSGQVGPPLPSKVQVVVTDPAGAQRTISGTANRVGYFYRPESDSFLTLPASTPSG